MQWEEGGSQARGVTVWRWICPFRAEVAAGQPISLRPSVYLPPQPFLYDQLMSDLSCAVTSPFSSVLASVTLFLLVIFFLVSGSQSSTLPSPLPIPTVFLFSLSLHRVPFCQVGISLPLSLRVINHLIPQGSSGTLLLPSAPTEASGKAPWGHHTDPLTSTNPVWGHASVLFGLVKSTALLCPPSL